MASGVWPVSFALLSNSPARYAMALREHQFGHGLTTTFALSVLADLAVIGPLFAFALAPTYWLAARRPESRWAARTAFAATMLTVVLLCAFSWVASVAATEFRIQRGSYPTLGETVDGLGDWAFLRGSAKIA